MSMRAFIHLCSFLEQKIYSYLSEGRPKLRAFRSGFWGCFPWSWCFASLRSTIYSTGTIFSSTWHSTLTFCEMCSLFAYSLHLPLELSAVWWSTTPLRTAGPKTCMQKLTARAQHLPKSEHLNPETYRVILVHISPRHLDDSFGLSAMLFQ